MVLLIFSVISLYVYGLCDPLPVEELTGLCRLVPVDYDLSEFFY